MKKIGLILISLFLLVGCEMKVSEAQKEYQANIRQLTEKKEKNFDTSFPFQIEVSIDSLVEGELVYSVVIDQPTEPISKVKVIAIHDAKTKDIFPSIGLFDEPMNLIPDEVNQKKKNVKGIALVGYIETKESVADFHTVIKVMITYQDQFQKTQYRYYYHKI